MLNEKVAPPSDKSTRAGPMETKQSSSTTLEQVYGEGLPVVKPWPSLWDRLEWADKMTDTHKLSVRESAILHAVARFAGLGEQASIVSQGKLAAHYGMPRQKANRVIQGLVKRGLVQNLGTTKGSRLTIVLSERGDKSPNGVTNHLSQRGDTYKGLERDRDDSPERDLLSERDFSSQSQSSICPNGVTNPGISTNGGTNQLSPKQKLRKEILKAFEEFPSLYTGFDKGRDAALGYFMSNPDKFIEQHEVAQDRAGEPATDHNGYGGWYSSEAARLTRERNADLFEEVPDITPQFPCADCGKALVREKDQRCKDCHNAALRRAFPGQLMHSVKV